MKCKLCRKRMWFFQEKRYSVLKGEQELVHYNCLIRSNKKSMMIQIKKEILGENKKSK